MLWEKLIMQFGGCLYHGWYMQNMIQFYNVTKKGKKKIVKVTRFIFHNLKKKKFNILYE